MLTFDVLPMVAIFMTAMFMLCLFLCKAKTDAWEKYGVKQSERSPLMFADFGKACAGFFKRYGRTFGAESFNLQLFTKDLNLLKRVIVEDFKYFSDSEAFLKSNSTMMRGVFFAKGDDWIRLRRLVAPTFCSDRLKLVFHNISASAKRLAQFLKLCATEKKLVSIKHITGQYTSEIIAETAFDIQTSCLGGEDDLFTRHTKRLVKSRNIVMKLMTGILLKYPSLYGFLVHTLKLQLFDSVSKVSNDYFESILRSKMAEKRKQRNFEATTHTDFLDLLMMARQAGENVTPLEDASIQAGENVTPLEDASIQAGENVTPLEDASISEVPVEGPNKNKTATTLSEDEVMGQCMLITFAAFETTAVTLQMVLYNLAKHPSIQERVFQEIETTVSSQIPTFEEIEKLHYAEQVIMETLRLFPCVTFLFRTASESRTYGTITIPKGCTVFVPIPAIMKDPRNFPDPDNFDPDRFTPENVSKRDPMTFLPFGYGPRACLGKNLAFLELKAALVYVLREVRVDMSSRSEPKQGESVEAVHHFLLTPKKPIQLEMSLRR